MKSVCCIILNRNLAEITDCLYESLSRLEGDVADFFIVESGSQPDRRSRYCTWWANWPEAMEHGLRYPRGFNYGLIQLLAENRFKNYDYFFLVCNDSVFPNQPVIGTLLDEMARHPHVGIMSPCCDHWGELSLLDGGQTRYFWNIQHISWLLRRSCVESISSMDQPEITNFLYDGTNFRGHMADLEIIAKGYANDWATAVTSKVVFTENDTLLRTKADLMKTDPYDENIRLTIAEGLTWLKCKYGFNDRWTFSLYAKFFYENFFTLYPECQPYKV